jgi:RNA polymerase sigma-70 factor (ECF subfamily)
MASQVFVRMVEKLDSFRPRGRPLLAWLYTVARNLITDHYRRQERATQLPLDESLVAVDDDPVRDAEQRLLADCLAKVLDLLTEEQRQVILTKFIEGYANVEVARMLGKTEGAIKSLQHRALAALRRGLERERCYER